MNSCRKFVSASTLVAPVTTASLDDLVLPPLSADDETVFPAVSITFASLWAMAFPVPSSPSSIRLSYCRPACLAPAQKY